MKKSCTVARMNKLVGPRLEGGSLRYGGSESTIRFMVSEKR